MAPAVFHLAEHVLCNHPHLIAHPHVKVKAQIQIILLLNLQLIVLMQMEPPGQPPRVFILIISQILYVLVSHLERVNQIHALGVILQIGMVIPLMLNVLILQETHHMEELQGVAQNLIHFSVVGTKMTQRQLLYVEIHQQKPHQTIAMRNMHGHMGMGTQKHALAKPNTAIKELGVLRGMEMNTWPVANLQRSHIVIP